MVFLEAIKFYPNGKIIPMNDGYNEKYINGRNKYEVMKHLSELPKFPGSACTKLISNKLIQENKLYFEKGLLSEDIEWTIRLLKVAKNFYYIDIPYYYYRQSRKGSITNISSLKNIECKLLIIERCGSKNISLEYQEEINSFLAYEFIVVLYNYSLLNEKHKKMIINRVENNKWILKYSKSNKIKYIYYMMKIFNLNFISLLLKIYKGK